MQFTPVPGVVRPLAPFDMLDRYELLARYAQGGMATVWLARLQGKHGFEKLIAVKTILPSLASDPAFKSMLLDEARIASRIRHPNVAEIDDLGEERGFPYLVFEWIDGDSLATLFEAVTKAGQPFPQDLLLRIIADACLGLHAAHTLRDEHGMPLHVVHRDVSPQNLLVSHMGVTKVIDFGVAKAADRLSPKTKTGLMKGKIEYAAPEQATLGEIDARTDVFACGVVLFQLLTGKLPYPGPNGRPLLAAVARATEAPRLPAFVPNGVAEVVRRAIAPQPSERFQSALELSNALSQVMSRPFAPSDVAAFVSTYLGHRAMDRKTLIAEARAVAAQRHTAERPSLAGLRPMERPVFVEPTPLASPPSPPVSNVRTLHKVMMTGGAVSSVAVWAVVAFIASRHAGGGETSAFAAPGATARVVERAASASATETVAPPPVAALPPVPTAASTSPPPAQTAPPSPPAVATTGGPRVAPVRTTAPPVPVGAAPPKKKRPNVNDGF